MIDETGHMPERDAMAAEYVLGTLPLPERLTAEALIRDDTDFAAMVTAWRERLSPLNERYEEVPPPPALLGRIEARLFAKPARRSRTGWLWGALAGAALAILALVVLLPPDTPDNAIVATLTGADQPLIVAARFDPDEGALTVNRSAGPAAEAGKDYELWLIPEGEAPVSIGIVRDGDLTIPLGTLPTGTTLAITLEPAGGSPIAGPTGPLLVAAVIGET